MRRGIGVLLVLVFSKYVYLACLTSYLTFYLMHRFALSVRDAQLELFVFSVGSRDRHDPRRPVRRFFRPQAGHLVLDPWHAAVHADVAVCEPVLDRAARGADRTDPRVGVSGDRRVRAGTRAGQGRHGLGTVFRAWHSASVVSARPFLGALADAWGIERVFTICSYLPAFGLFAGLLPKLEHSRVCRADARPRPAESRVIFGRFERGACNN